MIRRAASGLAVLLLIAAPAAAQDLEMPSLKDLPGLLAPKGGAAPVTPEPPALNATPADLACPGAVAVEEEFRGQVPKGWQNWSAESARPVADRRRLLAGITFYSGPPSQQASLAPTRTRRTREGHRLDWNFGRESLWLACRYQDSQWTLIKPLPRGIRRCEAEFDQADRVTRLACR